MTESKGQALDLVASIFHRAGQRLTKTPTAKGQPMKLLHPNPTTVQTNGQVKRDPVAELVEITPAAAAQWLELNNRNRKLDKNNVTSLARAMERGEWRGDNGETIKRTWSGEIVDGQHRLLAVVKSGVTIRCMVITGVPMEAQITVDTGHRRSLSQYLGWNGEKNVNVLAAGISSLHAYNITGEIGCRLAPSLRPTFDQAFAVLAANPGLRESVEATHKVRTGLKAPSGPSVAMHYVTCGWSPEDAAAFWDRLSTGTTDGAGLAEDDPIFVVRRVIMNNLAAAHRMDAVHKMAIIVKAWNSWLLGEKRNKIGWTAGGVRGEEFPRLLNPNDLAA